MTILVGTCSWADRVQEKVRKLYHTAPSAHLAWIDYGSYDGEDTDDYQCYLN